MTIIVNEVLSADKHANADALRVYSMSDGKTTLQIIANLSNVYEVGDHVLVANIGSILKEDNLEIKQTKIRGINSFGMALGKTDLAIGTDVSEQYCTEMPKPEGPQVSSWVDIESLFNIRKNLQAQNDLKKISYRCKVKIHGTSGGIQILPDKTLIVQSRTQVLSEELDNAGFYKWVMSKESYWKSLSKEVPITVYGEWAGSGIMNGCAIHQIDKKIFCIFAIEYSNENGIKILDTGPSSIEYLVKPNNDDIFVLPFMDEEFTLDFSDKDALSKQVEKLNELCYKVEKCDPFVREQFKIEGIGEGFVMYPIINNGYMINKLDFSEYVIKIKGDQHKVVNVKAPAQIDPEIAASIDEFVKLFVTENRLNQFAEKVGPFEMKNTGQFIKLLTLDIHKESSAELDASNMDWKTVCGAISNAARMWWVEKCKELT